MSAQPTHGADGAVEFDPNQRLPGPWSAVVVLLLAPLGLTAGQVSETAALIVAAAFVAGFLVIVSHAALLDGPPQPAAPPEPGPAPMPEVRPEPDRRVPVKSYNCRICGKPLTREESKWAGVGTTCITRYGPRPLYRPNPDYDRWVAEMAEARVAQAAAEAERKAAYQHALEQHAVRLEEWEAERWTAEAHARRVRRRRTTAYGIPSLAWALTALLGLVV